jgi:hypothetical protein
VAATKKSFDEASAQIRDTLVRRKLEEATRAHLDELKAKNVSQRDDGPLSVFNVPVDDGPLVPKSDASPKR